MTKKQKIIIEFARQNNNTLTKKDAMGLINTHYHNGSKHVGDSLSRMVKAGFLIRVKRGVFELGKGTRLKPVTIIENQLSIL